MHQIVSSCANHISRYICRQKHSKTGMTVVRGAKILKSRELINGRVSTMDLTPKKLLNSDANSFICSDAVTSKQRVCVFKSGNKGTSSVDLHRLINKALDIDVNVNWNSDIAVCITTVFIDTRLWKKKQHPRKRFQNFRQSCVLLTDRIEIHQSQPDSMTQSRVEGHTIVTVISGFRSDLSIQARLT